MNKVLVKIYWPAFEECYELKIPVEKKIYSIILMFFKGINELHNHIEYNPENVPILYNKVTAKRYKLNARVEETDIGNGTELILI